MYPVFLPGGSKFRNKKQNKNMQKYPQLLEIKKKKIRPPNSLGSKRIKYYTEELTLPRKLKTCSLKTTKHC